MGLQYTLGYDNNEAGWLYIILLLCFKEVLVFAGSFSFSPWFVVLFPLNY